ncbi:MAG: SDR family oxidoreductase [Clostridia bacterium]|nr:SDR family oxidoreductase [Clostridia bacterium]
MITNGYGDYPRELSSLCGIVTGGSSGIGYDISNTLAAAGAKVYVISRTGCPKEGYPESLPGVEHIKGDISDVCAMKNICSRIAEENGGKIDFLINNAGVSFKCRAEDFPPEEFDRIMNVNVRSLFYMCTVCYPWLKKSPVKGRIINITSMSAHLGFSLVVPYCASKGAVLSVTRGLAVEWADDVTVNSIAPGWFRSNMNAQIVDPEREKKILSRMPVHAYGDKKDIGEMVRYLCGPAASYITGQDFAIDGGALAYGY